jgi:two-component system nitrate/nitrite sensor histidine kinase NarX
MPASPDSDMPFTRLFVPQAQVVGPERKAPSYQSVFDATSDGLIIINRETGCVVDANPAACVMCGYARGELLGLPMARLMPPDSQAAFSLYLQSTHPSQTIDAVLIYVRKDGSPFPVEVHWTSFANDDQLYMLGTVRDVSARVESEQLLKQQVEAHAREQATLLEISQTLVSALELKPGQILERLGVLIEYTHASLFTLEDSTLVALAVRGSPLLERAMPFNILCDDPQALATLLNGQQPNRIADVWSADPAARMLRSLLNERGAMLLEGVHAWLWAPLTAHGRVIGGLSVAHAEPGYFTAHHADLAQTIANQAAITMVNVQLYEHAQTLAKLQERQRLAQELHDAVNQSLFSAGLIAEVLPRLWEQNPAEGRRSLEDLRRLTHGALAEMRGLLAELRPAIMTGADFSDLLRQLGSALTGRVNIPVSVSVVGQGVLPTDVQVALYRLCQEALSNIAKHAGASQVQIQVNYAAHGVEVHIMDNGCGFDPEHISLGHSGLSMMRERAEAIGATLSIISAPGRGTAITIRWAEGVEVQLL